MADVRIRAARRGDMGALARLFFEAVHALASRDYGEQQLNAWAPAIPGVERFEAWAADGRLFLVAADAEDEPIAFVDLERDGHIDHLFCRPDHAGTGVSAMLCDAMEAAARDWGLGLVYVEASEPARRFFERRGYSIVCRRDFLIRDVPIHNYRMEKSL